MITENISTLKIHKLTQEQYDRELAAGNIDENALYLTPDSGADVDIEELTEEEIAELCDFDGDPDNIIPIASKASLGCVIAGDGLDIDDNGILSVQSLTDEEIEDICEFDEGITEANVIPKATKTALGCIKVGDGLAIDSTGRLSATGGGSGVATAGIGSAGMKLLWENPDTTVDFSAQTVELDLSEYEYIKIECKHSVTGTAKFMVEASVGATAQLRSVGNTTAEAIMNILMRLCTISKSGVEFNNTYLHGFNQSSYTTPYNSNIIPCAIYGVDVAPPNVDYTLTEEKDVRELLWENPNPTATFEAKTIYLDLSEYDSVEIEYNMTASTPVKTSCITSVVDDNQFLLTATYGSSSAVSGLYRTGVITTSSIYFRSGWKSAPSSDTLSEDSCIPYRIYGIKNKINVTTAVVTDKGQHTDLLWENASPTGNFSAQTVNLDLNEYDGVEILYYTWTTELRLLSTGFISKDSETSRLIAPIDYNWDRDITAITNSGITFGTAKAYKTYGSTSPTVENNAACIPYQIYGIKHNAATTSTIMGDYVVEEGTEGIWTYEKWNSGKVVAETIDERTWGNGTLLGSSDTYYAKVDIILPMSGVTWEKAEAERQYGNMGDVFGVINSGNLEVWNTRFGAANLSTAKLLLRIIGKWK